MRTGCLLACLAVAAACVPAGAQDVENKLYSAIRANDLPGLKALLDQGVSPNAADRREITPLMYAAEVGSVDGMALLIQSGADVNAQNAFGSTALMWSVADPKKVRLLLDHGADVNKAARSGRTALIVASFANPSAEVVRLLIAKGADVKAADHYRLTPVYAATFGNDLDTIRTLVDAGADIDIAETRLGLTPLMNAAGNRNLAAVRLLLGKGARVNAVAKMDDLPKIQTGIVEFGGWTPLLMAAPFGPPEIVKALLQAGANVNAQDYRGFTALMLAVGTDRYSRESVRAILAHGADSSLKTHSGETALDWAYKLGDPQVIRSLGGVPKVAPVVTVSEQAPDIRTAIGRGMPLIEKTTATFFKTAGCYACHEQTPGEFAAAAVRAKGIPVDEAASLERRRQITSSLVPAGPIHMEGPSALGGADNDLYSVEGLIRIGYEPDAKTDYLAATLAYGQGGDGGWHLPGYSRSPIQDSDFSRTAIGLRALKAYTTPGRAVEMKSRIERAKEWLLHTDPVILEDFDMRLLGVAAVGASAAELRNLAKPILSRQQSNGGWAQRDNFASDAYATGMTLWILAETGVLRPDQPAYRKGVNFLLGTQHPDGSWHVASRATKFQEYFESGFPYKHDQWISTMATGWAVTALAGALDAPVSVSARASQSAR